MGIIMPMQRTIRSLDELASLAREVLAALPVRPERATVLGLSGDLGAGKTAFTKEIARALGVAGEVTSPTFVIEKRYATRDPRFRSLVHIDAYRLAGPKELERIGFRRTVAMPERLIVVEWPEIVSTELPEDAYKFTLKTGEHDERTVILPDDIRL